MESGSPPRHRDPMPEQLAAATLRNPEDTLHLLLLASKATSQHQRTFGREESEGESLSKEERPESDEESGPALPKRPTSASSHRASLDSFCLVKSGIISSDGMMYLIKLFFEYVHVIFPMVPHDRIPKTQEELAMFAEDEHHLVLAFAIIASRQDPSADVHKPAWNYFKSQCLSDIMCGKDVSVGTIEALLLLSEYLPRPIGEGAANAHEEEDQMSWMLVGTAVRIGYMLGLDQETFTPNAQLNDPHIPDTQQKKDIHQIYRERLAWTYCYMFDRQISIRLGKAFWSRGPGLCFETSGYYASSSARTNFPTLTHGGCDSLVQAYVELTQIMTSAHDILYPSKDHAISLIREGEYYKYLDAFIRSTDGFRSSWESRRWDVFPISECLWTYFHYVRLYVASFAFQAAVQRSASTALRAMSMNDGKTSLEQLIFPEGVSRNPDSHYILQGVDAAIQILKLCRVCLHPRAVLSYLPHSFYLYLCYAAVFLLKVVFVAVAAIPDVDDTLDLLRGLIHCLECAALDKTHPGARYARLLNELLSAVSQRKENIPNKAGIPAPREPVTASRRHDAVLHKSSVLQPPPQASRSYKDPSSGTRASGDRLHGAARPEENELRTEQSGHLEWDKPSVCQSQFLSTAQPSVSDAAPSARKEFAHLLSRQEAIDSEFWYWLSQNGHWGFNENRPIE